MRKITEEFLIMKDRKKERKKAGKIGLRQKYNKSKNKVDSYSAGDKQLNSQKVSNVIGKGKKIRNKTR